MSAHAIRPAPQRPRVYASGSNSAGEIRGWAALGCAVGASAACLRGDAVREMVRAGRAGVPLMIDTGAYAEVSADPARQRRAGLVPSPGILQVVRPITPHAWARRLRLAAYLAQRVGPRLLAVLPDRVGDPEESLRRMGHFRPAIAQVAASGAELMLPIPLGVDPWAYLQAGQQAAGVGPAVAGFPMSKGGTPPRRVVRFVERFRPGRVHLLGMGPRHPDARMLLRCLAEAHPDCVVSMDANLAAAHLGRATGERLLTRSQDAVRAEGYDALFGEVRDDRWAIHTDYTDLVGEPSGWMGRAERRRVASAAGLDATQAVQFEEDPDAFLQEPVDPSDPDEIRWWECPQLQQAIDAAWARFVDRLHSSKRKAQAIVLAFADHPASGQFPAPLYTRPLLRIRDSLERSRTPSPQIALL